MNQGKASRLPLEPNLYEALLSNLLSRLRIAYSGLEAANVQSSRTSPAPNVITFFAAVVNLDEQRKGKPFASLT
jgi:hypothetical protein